MSQIGVCWQQKHTQHASSMKTECDYLHGWIKKTVTHRDTKKSHQKMVNPRCIAGNAEEEELVTEIEKDNS